MSDVVWYFVASLTPVALLMLAFLDESIWGYVALGYITLFVLWMDRLGPRASPGAGHQRHLRLGHILSVTLALLHFPLLALGVWVLGNTPPRTDTIASGLALGLFMGQVSNSNAHELIHASHRWSRRLGVAVYSSMLFGHHASAHPLVHHVHVASAKDPNSARPGEGFYRFAPRAWIGSFKSGLKAETARRARQSHARGSHPYVGYLAGSLLALSTAWLLAGWGGVAIFLSLAIYAQMQLLLSDYVQHYGLRRQKKANGKPEPVGPHHSWNAPHWYSAALMLNAPRHSDHHAHPNRSFPELRLDPQTMPMLPHPLPIMAAIALVPPIWRRIMDPRAAYWRRLAESR
ncbi:alkane 1-monooxygenase [Thalassococcus sp. S3]|uniref:alkane 1-monooxygenase n=1 Tax=Thalassococcus sp. S3 TaxID=2017482 RepID=UPI00352C32ED